MPVLEPVKSFFGFEIVCIIQEAAGFVNFKHGIDISRVHTANKVVQEGVDLFVVEPSHIGCGLHSLEAGLHIGLSHGLSKDQ